MKIGWERRWSADSQPSTNSSVLFRPEHCR